VSHFERQDGILHIEQISLEKIGQDFGTPAYVYSKAAIEEAYLQYTEAFTGQKHLVCYAVKANSNLGVLSILANLGAGFDIVSGGELERVVRAGGDPSKVVFSGVAKLEWEIGKALELGIACFNIESETELDQINRIASDMNVQAPISIRVNPDVDAKTHPYISTGLKENKFGVSRDLAMSMYIRAEALSNIDIKGIDCHIGSQITDLQPFIEAMHRIIDMVDELEKVNIKLEHIDLGGGIGVQYKDESTIDVEEYAGAIQQSLGHRKHTLIFEPGRFIVANAGVLLSQVLHLKNNEGNNFVILDAGMNDLIRPALYQSWQAVSVVKTAAAESARYNLVGPICESGDFLARDRELTVAAGDYIAIHSSGAYGFSMSSNYNSRNRAVELIVSGDTVHQVRKRETIDDQLNLESLFPSAFSYSTHDK